MILSEADYYRVMQLMPVVCIDCLVRNDEGKFLLVKRRNEPLKGEYWLPGGRLHKHELLENGVHRKMREELNIEVEIIRFLGFFEEFFEKTAQNVEGGFHAVSFLYLVKPLGNAIRLDEQSAEWGWFTDIPPRLKKYATLQIGEEI